MVRYYPCRACLAVSRHDENRDAAAGTVHPDPLQVFPPVDLGEGKIQDDEVRNELQSLLPASQTVFGDYNV